MQETTHFLLLETSIILTSFCILKMEGKLIRIALNNIEKTTDK